MKTSKKAKNDPVVAELSGAIVDDSLDNISKVAAIEEAQKQNRTLGERVSEAVALFCGSMSFVYVHIVWFGGWIILNSLTARLQFDPFPYTFLTLVVSLEAIFLSTFILISQNHETKLTERRNHLDLQINMLAEQENTKMLELLQAVAEKVGVDCGQHDLRALLEPTDPAKLVEQIIEATDEKPGEAKSEIKQKSGKSLGRKRNSKS